MTDLRHRSRVLAVLVSAAMIALLAGIGPPADPTRARAARSRPNVVVILTDDQRRDSMWVLESVRRGIARRGTRFANAFVSNPLCCPSRASILTGLYSHTTGVWTNGSPNGGWEVFHDGGFEERTIAVTLDDEGYETALIGKYLNGYGAAGIHVPPGWDRWFAFAGPGRKYFDYEVVDSDHGVAELKQFGSDPASYSTDVLALESVAFIREADPSAPIFLLVAPFAPHGPSTPAPRHLGALLGLEIQHAPSYNEANVRDKPRYVRSIPRFTREQIALHERRIRLQYESLMAVDDLVSDVLNALRETGRMRETLVLFTSDNGFLMGEHRRLAKVVPYEEAIRVPLLARFGTRSVARSAGFVANVDLAPTIAELVGVDLPDVEGRSFAATILAGDPTVRKAVLLESSDHSFADQPNVPPYCGIRTARYKFVRYADGFEELYDLREDRYELRNVADQRPGLASRLRARVQEGCDPTPPGFSW